jgi:molybdate transport system substrate-binding protein
MTSVVFLTVFATVGCEREEQSEADQRQSADTQAADKVELVVLCGSSFVPPTDELIEQFKAENNIEVVTSSAGSEDFLPLVKAGRKGDILITHDPYLDYVKEANAYLDDVPVGFVAPVLAVAKGNPKGVKSIEDLAKPGLKVALTDPQYSTCGEMVFALLEKKGIKDAVLANVGNRLTKGHGNLGTLMQTGAVDAVIMWNGVAHSFKEHLEIVPTPYEYDTTIGVYIIGLGYSEHPEQVRQFISFAKEHGPPAFSFYGYVK